MDPFRRYWLLSKLASKQPAHNAPDKPGLWSQAVAEAKKAGYNGPWVAEYEGPEGDGIGYRKCLAWMKANID